ncbi:MAG: DNA polymerase III subunit gamma/tau [Nitrospiria bacterium]
MDFQGSARKWRPQTFQEVIGQQHVTRSIANALRLDKIAQAYLFSGIRGIGKTSLARILAKGINCRQRDAEIPCNRCGQCLEITEGRSVDVIEIDGASNTGVDDVRELREKVKYLPLGGRYKIYIIDEVHMLSNAAFNALLKTLEEPPPHLIFILATTEAHKIPETVLSRCQHFRFRRITHSEILSQLQRIAETREVRFSEKGLRFVASISEGSMRDALSILDQAISFGGNAVSDEDLFNLLGRMDASVCHALADAIHRKDPEAVLRLSKEIADRGYSLRQFLADWLEHLRHLIVSQNVTQMEEWMDLPKERIENIRSQAAQFPPEGLQRLFSLFIRLQKEIRNTPQPFLLFEVSLMKAIAIFDLQPIESVLERLEKLTAGETTIDTVERHPKKNKAEASDRAEPRISKPTKPTTPDTRKETPALSQESWSKLLKSIKVKRPNIASYLEQATLTKFTDHEIQLRYSESNAFLMSMIKKEDHLRWLDPFIKNQLQKEIKLTFIEDTGPEKSSLKPPEALSITPPKTEDPSQIDHPLIQEALKVMGGSIIETKRISNDHPI